jgi:UPF0755 protein
VKLLERTGPGLDRDESGRPAGPRDWIRGPLLRAALVLLTVIAVFVAFEVARSWGERVAEERAALVTTTLLTGLQVDIEIPPGSTAGDIADILKNAGVISSASEFENAVIARGDSSRLKAGDYTLVTGSSIGSVIDALVEGPVPDEVFTLRVIEGLRIEDMLASIADQTEYTQAELRETLVSGAIISGLLPEELPEGTDPLVAWEGLLAPDTYDFVVDASPADILQRLADTLETRVDRQDWSALADLGLTPYDGLVIASLIEREAKLDIDRDLISSVIYNRLGDGMLLQIDATVVYALGTDTGRVLESDLEVDSPWNTYKVAGLPPTPISGVRLASLVAAAQPADTGFFFYVLATEEGGHAFAETFTEHQANIAEARANGILP